MDKNLLILVLSVYSVVFGTTNGDLTIENLNNDVRIVNGTDAVTENTKYQVSIRLANYDVPFGRAHICGGTLINNRTVLTAAHCTEDDQGTFKASEFLVVMGTLLKNQNTPNTIIRRVKSVIKHKDYNPTTIANDIAILILSEDVPSNHLTVQPINITDGKFAIGTPCRITGWGTLSYSGTSPNHLQTANISILDINRCNSTSSYSGSLGKGMLCAGSWEGYIDSCQGDSGGPLVCNNVLAGVVSWGHECARPGYPGIYTDVSYYAQWIAANSVNRIITFNYITYIFITLFIYTFLN